MYPQVQDVQHCASNLTNFEYYCSINLLILLLLYLITSYFAYQCILLKFQKKKYERVAQIVPVVLVVHFWY